VPDELLVPHPLVKQTGKLLRQHSSLNKETQMRSHPGEALDIQVSRRQIDRALRLMDTLIKGVISNGFEVRIDEATAKTIIERDGVGLTLSLNEEYTRSRHEKTRSEKRALDDYWQHSIGLAKNPLPYPDIPQFDYALTGEFTLTLAGGAYATWRDTDKRQLEGRIHQIIIDVVMHLEDHAQDVAEKKRKEDQFLAAKARYEYLANRLEQEEAAFKTLETEAINWERAKRLRAYISAVAEQANITGEYEEKQNWIDWASQKADWVDPLIPVSDRIIDAGLPEVPTRNKVY
jgi:hypothetical protein